MNSNTIPQPSSNNLYVAHYAVKQKNEKRAPKKYSKSTDAPAPVPQPYQYISRSYYYDSMGGGYQGL